MATAAWAQSEADEPQGTPDDAPVPDGVLGTAKTNELDETEIRCRVCLAAVTHVWHTGANLREDCEENPRVDRLCDNDNVQYDEVEHLVRSVCEHLPQTHAPAAVPGRRFALVHKRHAPKYRTRLDARDKLNDEPPKEPGNETFHSERMTKVITASCKRWVHDRHTVDKVSQLVYTHLQAGEPKQKPQFLRRRFCFTACGTGSRILRNARNAAWKDPNDDEL